MKRFRLLRADEIDCRIAQVKQKYVSLLLYKDARCDMNILDETVGCMNWKKAYSRDNKNCTVSIWDPEKNQWISKEDTGTESYTEAEKGLASDSFKRACFNWGIGRELYSAPRIMVWSSKCNIEPKGQNYTCYDSFKVRKIGYDENENINLLQIVRLDKKGDVEGVAYELKPKTEEQKAEQAAKEKGIEELEQKADQKITAKEAAILRRMLSDAQVEWVRETYHIKDLEDLTARHYTSLMNTLKQREAKA